VRGLFISVRSQGQLSLVLTLFSASSSSTFTSSLRFTVVLTSPRLGSGSTTPMLKARVGDGSAGGAAFDLEALSASRRAASAERPLTGLTGSSPREGGVLAFLGQLVDAGWGDEGAKVCAP
jgi:hypothetical protein